MPFTMAAYGSTATRAVLTAVTALQDQSLNVLNNQYQIPSAFSGLCAAYSVGAHDYLAQLASPSLRKYGNYYVLPVDTGANPAANPPFEYLGFYNPIPITSGDLLQALVDCHGTTEWDYVLIWLATNPVQPVKGQMFPLLCTSDTTCVANQWTLGTLTPQTTLEEGIYSIVGMHAHFATPLAARLVPPGTLNSTRPGVIAMATGTAPAPLCFRMGRLGEWFRFDSAVFPQVEFLSTATPAHEQVILDLIKLTVGAQSQTVAYPGVPITAAAGVSPAPTPLY